MNFIDLKAQYKELKEEINSGIDSVLNHGQYIMGPEVYDLEKRLADFVGVKHAISCSSGTDALIMALMAMKVKPGDYIITTPFTYIATAEVISLLGAIPKFIDIDPNTFNIDLNKVEEELLNNPNKYKVIIPVDIFGLLADYDSIDILKQKYNIKVIEDGAQSFGASYNNKMSCSYGDISCTSFFPAKPLGCYGDGGAIFTNDDYYSEVLKSIRVHGQGIDKYNNIRIGINGRLDTIQAAILIPKLKKLKDEIESRNNIAKMYNEKIDKTFRKQFIPDGNKSAWAQYSILCDSQEHREMLINNLEVANIPSAIYYQIPLYKQEAFQFLEYNKDDFKNSESVSSSILSLPMHPYLNKDEQNEICKVINKLK